MGVTDTQMEFEVMRLKETPPSKYRENQSRVLSCSPVRSWRAEDKSEEGAGKRPSEGGEPGTSRVPEKREESV